MAAVRGRVCYLHKCDPWKAIYAPVNGPKLTHIQTIVSGLGEFKKKIKHMKLGRKIDGKDRSRIRGWGMGDGFDQNTLYAYIELSNNRKTIPRF